jgi:hypothetical protein
MRSLLTSTARLSVSRITALGRAIDGHLTTSVQAHTGDPDQLAATCLPDGRHLSYALAIRTHGRGDTTAPNAMK